MEMAVAITLIVSSLVLGMILTIDSRNCNSTFSLEERIVILSLFIVLSVLIFTVM